MRPVVIVFAKIPVVGRVKTRLAPALGDAMAARLHEAFVADTLATAGALADIADLELHTDADSRAWPDIECARFVQRTGSLSTRTLAALANALETRPQALVLGSDSPTLPAGYLRQLLSNPADVGIGLCAEGGYYAVCSRRAHSAMLQGVNWSSPEVSEQALSAFQRAGLTGWQAPAWYAIDTMNDLTRLRNELACAGLETAPATRRVLGEGGL